jgi:hypothetical protein
MIQFIPEPYGSEAFDTFLRSLLFADWESPDGPLRLNADLKSVDLADAEFFLNARLFLVALAEEDGAPATATGDLNRVFVGQMLDYLKLTQPSRDSIRRFCKVVNEQDVRPLHLVRVISECAKLVARRKKRFHLTKAGRALVPDEQAGALYRTLFLAFPALRPSLRLPFPRCARHPGDDGCNPLATRHCGARLDACAGTCTGYSAAGCTQPDAPGDGV